MNRHFSIDEEVAGGLLRLLGYASYSMSRACEPGNRDTADHADSSLDGAAPEGPGATPPAAAEQLFELLKLASRGEAPPKRPSSRPESSAGEGEPVSVRPERARPSAAHTEVPRPDFSRPPFPDVPGERTWRRAMILPLREAAQEARQVTLWLEAYIALHSTATPSGHGES